MQLGWMGRATKRHCAKTWRDAEHHHRAPAHDQRQRRTEVRMTEPSNSRASQPTHRERFAEACKITDFEEHPTVVGGYKVWDVSDIVKGGRKDFDGPYFTEDEARIAAELWQAVPERKCARAEVSIHCAAWNPDPIREKAIREDAMAARMILAEQIGAAVPARTQNDN